MAKAEYICSGFFLMQVGPLSIIKKPSRRRVEKKSNSTYYETITSGDFAEYPESSCIIKTTLKLKTLVILSQIFVKNNPPLS